MTINNVKNCNIENNFMIVSMILMYSSQFTTANCLNYQQLNKFFLKHAGIWRDLLFVCISCIKIKYLQNFICLRIFIYSLFYFLCQDLLWLRALYYEKKNSCVLWMVWMTNYYIIRVQLENVFTYRAFYCSFLNLPLYKIQKSSWVFN